MAEYCRAYSCRGKHHPSNYLEDPPMTAPTLVTRTFEGVTVPAPGTFELDPLHTTVGFVARHLMVSKVRGAFGRATGTITIGEELTTEFLDTYREVWECTTPAGSPPGSWHPSVIVLGVTLGAGALAVHAAMRLTGQPLPIGALAAAQLGVPVAAATVGSELHLLQPGEAAALILGALVTIGVAVLSGALAVRAGLVRPPDQRPSTRL